MPKNQQTRSKTTPTSKNPRRKKTPSSDGKRPSRSDPNKWNRTVLRHGHRLIALVEAVEAMTTALKNHFCVNIDPLLPDLPGMADTRQALLRQAFAAFKKAAKDGWAGATPSHDGENAGVFMVRWGDHDWPPTVCEASVLLNALVSAMESPGSQEYDPFMLTVQKTQWMQSMTRAANLILQAIYEAAAEKSDHNGGQEIPPATGKGIELLDETTSVTSNTNPKGQQQPQETDKRASPQVLSECPVELRGPGRRVLVLGKQKPRLTQAKYNVIDALTRCWPRTLTKDELVKSSGHTDARKTLSSLADSDSDWAQVINMAGAPGKGYGLIIETPT